MACSRSGSRVLTILLSSYRTVCGRFLALGRRVEDFAEVDRSGVLHRVPEALGDLGVAQLRLVAKLALDIVPQRPPGPCELPRDRRLVLAHQAPDLGEGQLLRVVAAQAQSVARAES